MKKLITSVLATLACFACLTGCSALGGLLSPVDPLAGQSSVNQTSDSTNDSSNSSTTGQVSNLDSAKNFLKSKYNDEIVDGRANYEVVNSITDKNVTYTVVWSVDVNSGVSVEKGTDTTKIVIDKTLSTDLPYTLTGTITSPDGASTTITFKRIATAAPLVPNAITAAPEQGTAYKFYIHQANLGKDLYMGGAAVNNYYFATLEDPAQAVDIYVENVEGGFYMYYEATAIGNQYVNIIKTTYLDDGKEKTKIHVAYETTAKTVWSFDATNRTVVADFEGNTYYMGARGTYNTVELSKTSYLANAGNYAGCLVKVEERSKVSDADKVAHTLEELVFAATYAGEYDLTLAKELRMFPEVTLTWALTGSGASVNGNVLSMNATASTTLTLKATATSGSVTSTKDIPIKAIPDTSAAIVEAAFALEKDTSFGNKVTLSGIVSQIVSAYDSRYANVTVMMQVGGKDLECYRLSGDEAANIKVGDTITVEGTIKNYNGTIEFDQGCTLLSREAGNVPTYETAEEILEAAYALNPGESLLGTQTLTGVITSVDTPYDSSYKNVTVTIVVDTFESMPIECYRVKGDGANVIAVGDTITVSGTITNFNGKIEFNQGCTLDSYTHVGGNNSGDSSNSGSDSSDTTKPLDPLPNTSPVTFTPGWLGDLRNTEGLTTDPLSLHMTDGVIKLNDIISITADKGTHSTSSPAYHKGDDQIRIYKGNTFTIKVADGYKITSITFEVKFSDRAFTTDTCDVDGTIAYDADTFDSVITPNDGTKDVVLTNIGSGQLRFEKMLVVYTTATSDGPSSPDEGENEGEGEGEGNQPPDSEPTVQTPVAITAAPAENTVYKLFMYQTQNAEYVYATGAMSGYYGASSTTPADGIDVTAKNVTGGFILSCSNAGATNYINVVANGTYKNFVYGTSEADATVWTFDTEWGTFVTTLGDEKVCLGAYGKYDTFGVLTASKVSATDYKACLGTLSASTTPDEGENEGEGEGEGEGNQTPDSGDEGTATTTTTTISIATLIPDTVANESQLTDAISAGTGITLSGSKLGTATYAPRFWSSNHLRVYANNTLTITATGKIVKIEITTTQGEVTTISSGTVTTENKVATIVDVNDTSVTITMPAGATQLRITDIKVIYEA